MLGMRTLKTAFSKLSLSSPVSVRGSLAGGSLGPYLQGSSLPLGQTSTTFSFSSSSTSSVCSTSTSTTSVISSVCSCAPKMMTSPSVKVHPMVREFSTSTPKAASLHQMHKTGPIKKKRRNKNPLGDKPLARGVVLKTLIKKPRKPNSANRKCVLVRLSTGKEMVAYIPGEGHSLQEHNIVLVRPGRLRDVPGVKLKCIRGKYDLAHVIKKKI